MAEQETTLMTSSHVYTKEATASNTTNSKTNVKTAEWTAYTWQKRADHIGKDKGAEQQSLEI